MEKCEEDRDCALFDVLAEGSWSWSHGDRAMVETVGEVRVMLLCLVGWGLKGDPASIYRRTKIQLRRILRTKVTMIPLFLTLFSDNMSETLGMTVLWEFVLPVSRTATERKWVCNILHEQRKWLSEILDFRPFPHQKVLRSSCQMKRHRERERQRQGDRERSIYKRHWC